MENHGIVKDEQAQEQPADKERAQQAEKIAKQKKEEEMQPLKESSGF
jgi:hypothetical protein